MRWLRVVTALVCWATCVVSEGYWVQWSTSSAGAEGDFETAASGRLVAAVGSSPNQLQGYLLSALDEDISFVKIGSNQSRLLSPQEMCFVPTSHIALPFTSIDESLRTAVMVTDANANMNIVDLVISSLGLTAQSHHPVDSLRDDADLLKLYSIALCLIHAPRILLVDEPVAGLTIDQSVRVFSAMRAAAMQLDLVVLCTMSETKSNVWQHIDDLQVMNSQGKLIYSGDAQLALEHFDTIGLPCPPLTSPLEFLFDLGNADVEGREPPARQHRLRILRHYRRHLTLKQRLAPPRDGSGEKPATPAQTYDWSLVVRKPQLSSSAHASKQRLYAMRCAVEQSTHRVSLLLTRFAKQCAQDKVGAMLRVGSSVVLAIVTGVLFGRYEVVVAPESIPRRAAAIAVSANVLSALTLFPALWTMQRDRGALTHELGRTSNRLLRSCEYVLAKLVLEIPLAGLSAIVFGSVVHVMVRPRTSSSGFVGVLVLLSASASSLGVALGAVLPAGAATWVGGTIVAAHALLAGAGPEGVLLNRLPWILKPFRSMSLVRCAYEALCSLEMREVMAALGGSGASLPSLGKVWESCAGAPALPLGALASRGQAWARAMMVPGVRWVGWMCQHPALQPTLHFLELLAENMSGSGRGARMMKALGIGAVDYTRGVVTLWKLLVLHIAVAVGGLTAAFPARLG